MIVVVVKRIVQVQPRAHVPHLAVDPSRLSTPAAHSRTNGSVRVRVEHVQGVKLAQGDGRELVLDELVAVAEGADAVRGEAAAAVGVVAEDNGDVLDEVTVAEGGVRIVCHEVAVDDGGPHVDGPVGRARVWDVPVLVGNFFLSLGPQTGQTGSGVASGTAEANHQIVILVLGLLDGEDGTEGD